jgi:NADH dehydrogenase FAD-containing subunit
MNAAPVEILGGGVAGLACALHLHEARAEWDTIDGNITFRPSNERYSVTVWAKDLTDERTRIAANSVAGLWNFTMYGRPRSHGIEIGVYFVGQGD